MKNSIFLLAILLTISNIINSQEIVSPYQIIPELYPTKNIRVAFHVIHKFSTDDTTNIPDNEKAANWWGCRVDSINYYLSNLAIPNYGHYKIYASDSRIQIKNMGIYHHINPEYWNGVSISEFYEEFVRKNRDLSCFLKDSVLHSFYYGDEKWGGMSGGIPSRQGMRFKGRNKEYRIWASWPPLGHARNDHNYIHELLHSLGTYHNFKNSPQGTECSGCDAKLGGFCFDMSTKPYAANNYMAKGQNVKPGGHSITLCQQQRVLFFLWGYDKQKTGTIQDVSMLRSQKNEKYNANLKDSVTLDYDFKAFGNIIIKENSTFIISSKIELPLGSKIIIKQGAALIYDETKNKSLNTEKAKSTSWHFWKDEIQRRKGGRIFKYTPVEF
tara:strand:- start:9 stop:1160 length:1152 start_codon:yes stop_codon:yes gene_type:complete